MLPLTKGNLEYLGPRLPEARLPLTTGNLGYLGLKLPEATSEATEGTSGCLITSNGGFAVDREFIYMYVYVYIYIIYKYITLFLVTSVCARAPAHYPTTLPFLNVTSIGQSKCCTSVENVLALG